MVIDTTTHPIRVVSRETHGYFFIVQCLNCKKNSRVSRLARPIKTGDSHTAQFNCCTRQEKVNAPTDEAQPTS